MLSARVSLTRYQIEEEVSSRFVKDVPDLLKKYAFREIEHSADERSFGWVCFDDFLDSNWVASPPEKGEFLAFSLRLDTRRIAPAVMNKHFQLALDSYQETMKEKGSAYISKDEKQEIKEQVRLKLMAKTLPVPAVFDCVWNTTDHTIYLGTTNSKIQEMFEELFALTFGFHLLPLNPYYLAMNLVPEPVKKSVEEYSPAMFV